MLLLFGLPLNQQILCACDTWDLGFKSVAGAHRSAVQVQRSLLVLAWREEPAVSDSQSQGSMLYAPGGKETTWASRVHPAAKGGDGAGLRYLCSHSLSCCVIGCEAGLALLSCGLNPLPLLSCHTLIRIQLTYHILAKPPLSGINFSCSVLRGLALCLGH